MCGVENEGEARRRDANPERIKAFEETEERLMKQYFDSQYGHRQLVLWILGTHPDYQRKAMAQHWPAGG